MLVYTCKNQKCKKYLINEIALCKVVCDGKEASLDLEKRCYSFDDGVEFSKQANCFHCRKRASKIEMPSEVLQANDLLNDLENLDSEIEALMKTLGDP